jgi:5-methylcytosine-specific restriction endonuclease McrA
VLADEDGLKRCSKCGERKDPSKDFGKHPKARDGLQTACKDCYAEYQAGRRADPAKKAIDAATKKRSTAKKPEHYNKIHNTARQARRADPVKRRRELDQEKTWKDAARIAQYNHARRARKLNALVNGPLPPGTYAAVLVSGACVYCDAEARTVDHIVPLARGGYEIEDNLVPCCASCNSRKGAKLLTEWDQARVSHAAAHSEKVAAQLALQLAA